MSFVFESTTGSRIEWRDDPDDERNVVLHDNTVVSRAEIAAALAWVKRRGLFGKARRAMDVYFYSNGNLVAVDASGEQVPEAQGEAWYGIVIRDLIERGLIELDARLHFPPGVPRGERSVRDLLERPSEMALPYSLRQWLGIG